MQSHLMPHAKAKAGIVLQSRGSIFIDGKEVLVIARRTLLGTGPRKREKSRQNLRRALSVESYSTVKSAQRLSATLSIRPSGRVQIIDM
jgi:hypothetical protein